MAVDGALGKVAESCWNFVCKVLALEVAFLLDVGNSVQNVLCLGKFLGRQLAVWDCDFAVVDDNVFGIERLKIVECV